MNRNVIGVCVAVSLMAVLGAVSWTACGPSSTPAQAPTRAPSGPPTTPAQAPTQAPTGPPTTPATAQPTEEQRQLETLTEMPETFEKDDLYEEWGNYTDEELGYLLRVPPTVGAVPRIVFILTGISSGFVRKCFAKH